MIRVVLVACALVACAHPAPPPAASYISVQIAGTRADMKTTAGAYDGYRVETDCRDRDCFGVVGAGTRWYPGMERERINENARFMAGFDKFRAEIVGALGHFVNASGWGAGCHEGSLILWIPDWRTLDESIRRVGALLKTEDLREPVTVCIGALNAVDVAR